MRKLQEYPPGFPLFDVLAQPDHLAKFKRNMDLPMPPPLRVEKGIPFAIEIWYDPPVIPTTRKPSIQIKAASSEACTMMFQGTANGASATIALDSMAGMSFIDQSFARSNGFSCTPSEHIVEMADGSLQTSTQTCMVRIQMRTVQGEVVTYRHPCLVLSMSTDCNIILGDDWLIKSKATLVYATRECLVTTSKGEQISLRPIPTTLDTATGCKTIRLSAIQMKRELKRPQCKAFIIHVVDSGVAIGVPDTSPFVPEEGDDHPLDPPEEIVFPTDISRQVRSILEEYRSVFYRMSGKLVDRGIDHVIPTLPEAKPTYRAPYRLSPAETREVEKQIAELLLLGCIEPSSSPYGAPIVFVPKPDGSLRMCIDYRLLNSITVKNKFPLPRVDQLLDQLQGAKVFSSLDLQSGYYQIRINPEDVAKTAFITPYGSYQFKVLSMGLCNSAATFQAVMNKLFAKHKDFCCVYLDDLLIFSKNPAEHAQHLATVLKVLKENELFCKLKKCDIEKKELKFLGHLVGQDGIKVDPAKTAVVQNWPTPTSVTQVRSFLGLANYFRKFLQGYSSQVAPLVALTRQGVFWNTETWTPECQAAFDGVKLALTQAPTLAMANFEEPFEMEILCDASLLGIGAVLTQQGRPIAYESKKLTETEKRWTTGDQELWAVIHALKTWRCYVEGIQFTIVTDHNPLIHLQTQPNLSRRQARWAEYLQRFNFTWAYRPGRDNVADPLSRHPLFFTRIRRQIRLCNIRTSERLHKKALARASMPSDLPTPTPMPQAKGKKRVRYEPRVEDITPPVHEPTLDTTDAPPDVEEDLMVAIQEGYRLDPWFSIDSNLTSLKEEGGLWFREQKIVIPDVEYLRRGILYELHDAPYSGHPGVSKTLKAVSSMYWWPSLKQYVQNYIQQCGSCQRVKASQLVPAGTLQPLPIPENPWDSVSMDFITGLPKTKRGFDAIIVFVCRLTKMTHIIPTTTSVNAIGTAQLFRDHVWKLHGVPLTIVSDRGSVFVGKFITELLRLIGTTHNRSTAYHPQTDGQTERVNRILEDIIRHYVGDDQADWDQHVSTAEFAINNAHHESTGTTPFRLNNGRDPRLPLSIQGRSQVPSAAAFADKMSQGLARAKQCIQAAQSRQKRFADEHRRELQFSIGDKVLLSTKNINLLLTKHKATNTVKLLPRWMGPFTVLRKFGNVAYELQLPPHMRVHPVFHVSLLKAFIPDGKAPPPVPEMQDGKLQFQVEAILAHKIVSARGRNAKGKKRKQLCQYLIRWTGYDSAHDSWEPDVNIRECETLYSAYWAKLGMEPPVRVQPTNTT